MLLVAYALALLTVLAAAYAFVKPYTKEKFFFLGVAAVHLLAVLFAAPAAPGSVAEELERAEQQRVATEPDERFDSFLHQLRGEVRQGHAAEAPVVAEATVSDPIGEVLEESYPLVEGGKPLYFREIVVGPLGRVVLDPPATPGVDVVTTWTPLGPELPRLTHRQPLGVLDPMPGQALPED